MTKKDLTVVGILLLIIALVLLLIYFQHKTCPETILEMRQELKILKKIKREIPRSESDERL